MGGFARELGGRGFLQSDLDELEGGVDDWVASDWLVGWVAAGGS